MGRKIEEDMTKNLEHTTIASTYMSAKYFQMDPVLHRKPVQRF